MRQGAETTKADMTAAGTVAFDRPMRAQEWAMLFAIALFWGSAFFFVAVAVHELPPLTLGAIRLTIGGGLLTAILYAIGQRLPLRRDAVIWCFVVAFVNSVAPLTMLAWAQKTIPGGLTAILNATGPLMTLFVAHALTKDEKLIGRKLAGALIGITGIVAMVGMDVLQKFDASAVAQLVVLVATLCFAFGTVLGRRFRTLGVAPLGATAGVLLCSALMFVPLSLIFDQPWTLPAPSWSALGAAIGAGVISTTIGHFLFFRLLAQAGANNAALVSLLSPITAVLMGALLLHERIEARHLMGMATVAIGIAVADGRASAWLRRRLQR